MTQENETQAVLKAYPNHREEGTEPRPEWKSRHLTPSQQLLFHGVLPPPEGHALCSGRCGPGGIPWEGRAPTRPGSLSPGLPLCLCVLRAHGPHLGTCLADNTVPGTHFPRWIGCRDLKTARILSLPRAAEHVPQRTYTWSPSTNGRCKQLFCACRGGKPWTPRKFSVRTAHRVQIPHLVAGEAESQRGCQSQGQEDWSSDSESLLLSVRYLFALFSIC